MMEWIVTSSAMILIVIALRGLLKGKISLKLQYGLWALVLIRLLLPFSIVESAISISNVLSAPVIQEADDAVEDYESTYQNVVQQHEASGTEYSDTEIRQQVQQELYDRTYEKIEQEYAQTGAAVPQIQIQTEAQHQVEVISLTAVLTEALPYLWIAGMIVVAVALTGSNLHFWWKLRQSRKAMDIPGVPLKVYLTDYVATPCLFGAVKPDIYLTGEVMSDSQMRRHVIAHEMSHYRQGDHLWSLLRCLCLVLHWYNPLVWAAAILSKQDAELACDEATIKALGEAERVAYGRTLIGMTCVRRDPGSLMLTATTMLGTKKTLKERIALIAKKPKTALYTLIACVLVVSLAVGCTFTGAPTEPTEEKDRIWQQVVEAVEQRNSSQSQHMTLFVRAEDIHEIDFETTPKNSEYWTYGGTCYTELNTLDGMVPHILQHNGKIYNHEDQNRWTSFGDSTDTLLTYLDLSRDENLVTGWTELDGQLEVVLKNGTEDWIARLDAEGKLLWLVTENIGLTWVYYYHDTPAQEIRQKVESVVSNMEIIERDDVLTAQEMLLLDRCGEAVEYIQNLEHFEITEHYEIIEESDFVLSPNSVEARYVYSGDDWYHNRVTPDWTWQFLEKDGEQFRKDITNAVPEEDIPAIEWIRADLSENYYAQHAWIMDIYWRNKTIGYLTYTGNGDGYEGGSMTPIAVTYDAEGSSEWISVEFEPGGEQVYDSEAGEGIRWILTFRFDRETGIVTEVTREIVMEDREIHAAGINGGTEHVDFHSTCTLTITPGTEEEMSAIIDDIYNDEILTAVSGQESPTSPTTEPMEPPTEPTVPLTVEEQFQQMLSDDYWYWRIAGCVFDDPVDIDMSLMFYTGMEEHMDWDDLTEAEQEFLLSNSSTGGTFFGDPERLPAEEMNTVLQEYLGITLSDVKIPPSWDYFDQTDAYYRSGTDAYGVGTSVTEVRQDGPFVYVYYTSSTPIDDPQGLGSFNDPQMVMTLEEKADGGYYVRSNQVVSASKFTNLSGFSLDQEPYYYPFTAQEIADAKVLALDYLDSIVHAPDELRYLKVNSLEFDPALSEAYAARMYGYDGYDPAPAFGGIMLFTVDYEYSRVDAYGNVVLARDTGYVYCHRARTESAWRVAGFGLTTDTIPQRPTKISSVEDLVTITERVLTYSGSGGENTVTANLPEIFPISQQAIETQLELDRFAIDFNIMSVESSASLTNGVLSVVIRETTYYDVEYYTIYNFNMETGNLMDTPETVSVVLDDVSYVRFLAASHQYALDETRAIFDEREEFYRENGQLEYYQDVLKEMEIDTVRMYANDLCYTEDGLCLYYWRNTLSGAANYPTLLPLSGDGPDWDDWTEAEAYGWFFNLEISEDNKDGYGALLLRALYGDPEGFLGHLNGCSQDKIDEISIQVMYGARDVAHQVRSLLEDVPDSTAKTSILNRLGW